VQFISPVRPFTAEKKRDGVYGNKLTAACIELKEDVEWSNNSVTLKDGLAPAIKWCDNTNAAKIVVKMWVAANLAGGAAKTLKVSQTFKVWNRQRSALRAC